MGNIFLHTRNRISAQKLTKEEQQSKEEFRKNLKQVFVIFGILACFGLLLGGKDLYEYYKLSKNSIETYGTMCEYTYIPKGRSYLTKCRFYVKGRDYLAKSPVNRPLKYGDTLSVLYCPENPKINRLIVPDSLKN